MLEPSGSGLNLNPFVLMRRHRGVYGVEEQLACKARIHLDTLHFQGFQWNDDGYGSRYATIFIALDGVRAIASFPWHNDNQTICSYT
jgi:hypothetical protein